MMEKIVMAFSTWSWGIDRRNTLTFPFPRAFAAMNNSSTTKVTVFIPPAVEPEEPPTNISATVTALPASVICPWSKEAKPAVLVLTDWKNPLRIFSPTVIVPKVPGLFHSKAQNRIPPPIISTKEVINTNFE